jgi:hypothetical protein
MQSTGVTSASEQGVASNGPRPPRFKIKFAKKPIAAAVELQSNYEEKHEDNTQPVPSCVTLYDPCTKEELVKTDPLSGTSNYDLKQLEIRLRDIKRMRDKTPYGLYGLTNDTSNYDFLMNVFCDKSITLDDMVSFKLHEKSNPGSDIFEVLCRLFVIFGGIDSVNMMNGDFKMMMKIENSSSMFDTIQDALQKMNCKATSKSGVSDITLVRTKISEKEIKLDSPYCEVECEVKEPDAIKTYLMSVKWYQKEKGAEHYDLEKLFLAGENIVSMEKYPFSILVFLKSKSDFEKAHRRSYRQYVSRIAQTFFGWEEDVKPFLENIRNTLFQNAAILSKEAKDILISQYFTPLPKQILSLQLHQDLIVTGINDLLETNPYDDNKYLIGVLPRGGKTFIAGGIIREYMNRHKMHENGKRMNILWITAAPNETRDQVGKDLILKYSDFNEFDFADIKNITEFKEKREKQHTFWFCSIQLLNALKGGRAKERQYLENLLKGFDPINKINMVFFDEAHAGGAGLENKKVVHDILNSYSQSVPFIFLSATYLSIATEYEILKTNLFIWDYTDVLKTRALATESEKEDALINLKLRFREELVTKVINRRLENTDSFVAMAKPYMDFPELYFLSCEFNDEAKERFSKQNMYNSNKGFSLRAIFGERNQSNFQVKTANGSIRKDAYKYFANVEHPRNLISLFTPSDPTQSFAEDAVGGEPFVVKEEYEQTILKRVERISNQTISRFRIDEYPTLLMFLPTGGYGSDISKLLPAFAALLMNHSWWSKRYEVACVVSDVDRVQGDNKSKEGFAEDAIAATNIKIIDKNIKSELLQYERRLHCLPEDQRKGLVILAGDRLSMGISLPCTDCVFLLNETKSPDDIIQKMYRALTPSIHKKSSFVIDLNPKRSLSAVYGYTRAAYQSATTNSSIIDIIYDVYSWDEDVINFKMEKGGSQRINDSEDRLKMMLLDASKDKEYQDIFKDIGALEKKLRMNIKKRANHVTPLLRDIITTEKLSTSDLIKYVDRPELVFKNGKVVIRSYRDKEEGQEENQEEEKKENDPQDDIILLENFTEAVSNFIKYLAATAQSSKFEEAIDEFDKNIVNNSGASLQNDIIQLLKAKGAIKEYIYLPTIKKVIKNPIKNDLIVQLFMDVVKKHSQDTSRDIFNQMRGKINDPDIRKNEVLKIIHKHLTPKSVEKEQHGEVFTPVSLIEKMFNQLPKSVWSNPDLKFLDPANGIGNFPIIAFYKLNEGLKNVIPTEQKRKKHIIENMLFMIEIQSNNTRISKNIFSKLCQGCKPNIWTQDSLKITQDALENHGWPSKFDIIMGNPPYQSGGTHQSGTTIWPHFITLYINFLNKNGYMTFVNGQSWREVAENSKDARNIIREHNLTYVNILGNAFAGINYPVDFFVLKNNNKYETTTIHNEELNITEEVDITKLPVIPNYCWNVFERWNKEQLPTLKVLRTYDTTSSKKIFSDKKVGKYQYPIVMNINAAGKKIKYSEKEHSLQKTIKVLVAFGSSLYPFVDKDGEYGLSENVFAIPCSNVSDANKIASYLDNNIVKCLINALKIGTYAVKDKLLSLLPDPTEFKSDDLSKNLFLKQSDISFLSKCKVSIDDEKEPIQGGKKRFNKTRKHNKSIKNI